MIDTKLAEYDETKEPELSPMEDSVSIKDSSEASSEKNTILGKRLFKA